MSLFFVFAVLPFMLVVLPMWIIFNFLGRLRTGRQLSADQELEMKELYEMAQKTERRLDTLESILNQENPDWRNSR